MPQTKKKTLDNNNYYFVLKCLAGLGAAAIAAAGVIAAIAASKGTAVAATVVTAKALAATAAVGTSVAAASIALPIIIGAAALIGAICLLPLLFCRSARPATYVATGPGYVPYRGGWWSNFWNPTPVGYVGGLGRAPFGGRVHGHP